MNAHVLELHIQSPAMGSQNGVEQLDDTERGGKNMNIWFMEEMVATHGEIELVDLL